MELYYNDTISTLDTDSYHLSISLQSFHLTTACLEKSCGKVLSDRDNLGIQNSMVGLNNDLFNDRTVSIGISQLCETHSDAEIWRGHPLMT